ncbi:hypothetical protein Q6D67_01425 [Haliea sp. E1-2-M8]|uniref:alpha/beta hydrolase family protein n=1 Tax=Haliea sp. E1-2-M8 TaxID=3064706 RepID=UPI00271A86EB|nr:CocE/NonD family hydrolase [Haliea sp. E1-2-M8]MDO8860345.1 hypothetical protein [Haliea sp. E1-2-M8]
MKTFFKVMLILGVIIGVVLLVLVNGKQPEPFPPGSESASRLQPGPLAVARLDTRFVDPTRPTAANGDYAGRGERQLEASVWYPEDREYGPYPLLVYSHGFSSSRREAAYLAQHLASFGYVVVAADFPLTSMLAPGGPQVKDVVNQPEDVSFLIDSLLQLSADAGHTLHGQIDPERIGALGLSLGGLTTTLAAFHPDLRDPRIKAALSIAGPTFVFTPAFYRHHSLPFLMLAGDIDALVPYAANAAPVPERVPGGELITLHAGSHTGFAGPAAVMRWLDNPDVVGCWIVQRNAGDAMEEPWFDLIGPPEMGVDYAAEADLCTLDSLPVAMNTLRQQMITRVAVSSFFERQFSRSAPGRAAAARYLQQILPAELDDVTYVPPAN